MQRINIHSKIRDYSVKIDFNLLDLIENNLDKNIAYLFIIDNKLVTKWKNDIFYRLPKAEFIAIEGGENCKSFDQYNQIISQLSDSNFSKNDTLVAMGGGTITDLVGYVASTYKRGVNFISIPTTTLAMVDASVGGKNAINMNGVKNSVGTIYPPSMILIGIDTLDTLPSNHFNNGLFESLKMGLIYDKQLFDVFKGNYQENIFEIIVKSIEIKKHFVELDEDDTGVRKVLNFGHTFGHAIESCSDFEILHGEAIANGMLIASQGKPYVDDLKQILLNMGCNIISNLNEEKLMKFIKNDKKACKNGINFVIVDEIGQANIVQKSFDELERMAENYGI